MAKLTAWSFMPFESAIVPRPQADEGIIAQGSDCFQRRVPGADLPK